MPNLSQRRVVDLGCGKGAVAISLAKAFGCRVEGIDALPAFIDEARRHAGRLGVSSLCQFTAGDLRSYLTASAMRELFARTGWDMVEERQGGGNDPEENRLMTEQIRARAGELKLLHPELASLFDGYVRAQEEECRRLEFDLSCATWLLRRAR